MYTIHECDLTLQDAVMSPTNISKRHVFESDNLGTATGFASDEASKTKKHFVVCQHLPQKCYIDWY